jgi:hypothetical protein
MAWLNRVSARKIRRVPWYAAREREIVRLAAYSMNP